MKKIFAFASAIVMIGSIAGATKVPFTAGINANATDTIDTTLTVDYVVSTSVTKISDYTNVVSNAEVTETDKGNQYTWYIRVIDGAYQNSKGLKVTVLDDGKSYNIEISPTEEICNYFRETYPNNTDINFLLPQALKIKFNELLFEGNLENNTINAYKLKNNDLGFIKKYDSDKNFVDYTSKNPELPVTYTSDKAVILSPYVAVVGKYELHYVNADYIDYTTADSSIEILGQKFEKQFKANAKDAFKAKSGSNIVYTKNFDTTSGNGFVALYDDERGRVVENITQSSLQAVKNAGNANKYKDGNYYQYVAMGQDNDYNFGTNAELIASIEKTYNTAVNPDIDEVYNNNNVKYNYDKKQYSSMAKVFDFDFETLSYFRSSGISDTTFTLKNCSELYKNFKIYIGEGFESVDDGDEVKQVKNTEITVDDIIKVFPDKKIAYYKGDINEDGAVNIADAIEMQQYLLNTEITSPVFDWENADMNDDGSVDVFDMVMLKQAVISNTK